MVAVSDFIYDTSKYIECKEAPEIYESIQLQSFLRLVSAQQIKAVIRMYLFFLK